ncbi:hypothetical protein F5H01DRAFT_358818 [Linnemannia elongata]|nr:hypothetical protein F5H01DRAFT_358818 [Linnemannia elongata]
MATPACDTFFSLPDLLSNLTPFLTKDDLVQLLQTNRIINSICRSALWSDLDLTSSRICLRLVDSPEALKAFNDNIHSVKAIKWNVNFSWYYIRALWNHLSTPTFVDYGTIPTDALTDPSWGKMIMTSHYRDVEPLPPLLRLTRYTGKFSIHYQTPHAYATHLPHQHQLLWLLRLNRTSLTHLTFEEAPFLSVRLFRDVCRTVSQLVNLKTLQLLGGSRSNNLTPQFLKTLFFSCPGSLVEFKVSVGFSKRREDKMLGPEENEWDFGQGPLQIRGEPLRDLKSLELYAVKNPSGFADSFLCPILRHCPALKKLKLRGVTEEHTIQDAAKALGEYCHNLVDLSLPSTSTNNGEALMQMMGQIQGPGLEVISVRKLYDKAASAVSIAAITRHSSTLREIQLSDCEKLQSTTLQVILVSCQALEVLRTGGEFSKLNPVSLRQAVVTEWACTRIRVLEITVAFTLDGRDPAYLTDRTMETWTEDDHDHWRMLDTFYTQIGSLTSLEVLNIKSAGSYRPSEAAVGGLITEVPFRKACLPGLLALEDALTGQLGFLSRWVGLKKLRELCGSFLWTNPEAVARIGEREVEWFVTHLPSLRRASFLAMANLGEFGSDVHFVPRTVRDLQARRPRLVLNDFM